MLRLDTVNGTYLHVQVQHTIPLITTQIHNGHRVTSATSYLAQAFNRSNLDILVNTRVTKLVPVGNVSGKPDLRAVQFAQSANGKSMCLFALCDI